MHIHTRHSLLIVGAIALVCICVALFLVKNNSRVVSGKCETTATVTSLESPENHMIAELLKEDCGKFKQTVVRVTDTETQKFVDALSTEGHESASTIKIEWIGKLLDISYSGAMGDLLKSAPFFQDVVIHTGFRAATPDNS
jgi:hypothetical protein